MKSKQLESVITEWDSALQCIAGLDHVFIICEDGSSDGTKELIADLEHRFPVINNSVSWRRGYGQAVVDGLALAETEYVLCIDGDGQIGPYQIAEAWRRRSKDRFLIGWRHPRIDPLIRIIYSKLFKLYHGTLFPKSTARPKLPIRPRAHDAV